MTINFSFPDCFAPSEKEFRIYCLIKLLNAKYIDKTKALSQTGLSELEFDKLFSTFITSYKRICGRAYTDWEYEEDAKERE